MVSSHRKFIYGCMDLLIIGFRSIINSRFDLLPSSFEIRRFSTQLIALERNIHSLKRYSTSEFISFLLLYLFTFMVFLVFWKIRHRRGVINLSTIKLILCVDIWPSLIEEYHFLLYQSLARFYQLHSYLLTARRSISTTAAYWLSFLENAYCWLSQGFAITRQGEFFILLEAGNWIVIY